MLLDTPICDFGWKAPSFELSDPHGKTHKLDNYLGQKGLLIAFICNHCPYVQGIADRLMNDAKTLQDEGINVLAIMPNDYNNYPQDNPDNMKKFAQQHNMTFPYLIDETQEIAKIYDAVCTPDFFGFNAAGELQYRGRLDSAGMGDAANRVPELLNAMRLISKTGQGPKEQYSSMGCSIKWK